MMQTESNRAVVGSAITATNLMRMGAYPHYPSYGWPVDGVSCKSVMEFMASTVTYFSAMRSLIRLANTSIVNGLLSR
jgi:hypothetical protein